MLIWMSCLFLFTNAYTQTITVRGKVTSGTETLPGVNVLVKGTTTGAATDAEGNYSITVPNGNATLVFSFIGFIPEEVPVNNRTTIDVALVQDIQALN